MNRILVCLAISLSVASAVELTGHWQGRIQIPNHELAISVDLAKQENGSWIGSMSVTGSGTIDVPLTSKVPVWAN